MGDRLTPGRLELIDRYMHGYPDEEPPKGPPWTTEPAPAPAASEAPRPPLRSVEVERQATDATPHSVADLELSTDHLHRHRDTYDLVAGAMLLAERARQRRDSAESRDPDESTPAEDLHRTLVERYTRRRPG